MLSELSGNHVVEASSPGTTRDKSSDRGGELVARDLSLEFKENRQDQATDQRKVRFKLARTQEAGAEMSVLGGSNFESPRRREVNKIRHKEKVGYSPASKLIVPPISTEPFHQLSRLVNGVKDLERRMRTMERLGQEDRSVDEVMATHINSHQLESARKKLAEEVQAVEKKLSEMHSKLGDLDARPLPPRSVESRSRPGMASIVRPASLVTFAAKATVNLALLFGLLFLVAALRSYRDTAFVYEIPS